MNVHYLQPGWIGRDAFVFYPLALRQFEQCQALPDLDLNLWRIDGDGLQGKYGLQSTQSAAQQVLVVQIAPVNSAYAYTRSAHGVTVRMAGSLEMTNSSPAAIHRALNRG